MRKNIRLGFAAILASIATAAHAQTQNACAGGVPDQIYAAYVRTAQIELNLHGYDAGRPDGEASLKTQAAARDYQKDAHLPVDGCVSKGLVDHLQFVLPRVEKARGTRANPLVAEAQTLLTRRGYYIGAVDGIDGSRTREALRRFQEDARLPPTGGIDRSVVDAIESADPAIRGDTPPAGAPPTR